MNGDMDRCFVLSNVSHAHPLFSGWFHILTAVLGHMLKNTSHPQGPMLFFIFSSVHGFFFLFDPHMLITSKCCCDFHDSSRSHMTVYVLVHENPACYTLSDHAQFRCHSTCCIFSKLACAESLAPHLRVLQTQYESRM